VKFYSAEDIDKLAAQGIRELALEPGLALTDVARERARQLGIVLVTHGRAPAGSRTSPASAAPSGAMAMLADKASKPKGCQHGALPAPQLPPAPAAVSSKGSDDVSGDMVDQLVGLVKQLGSKESRV
jgi:hypothetical protein